ncbi:MAG: DNA topoisomerase I, partial [Candidatus Berkelbacteria bacterium Licking1014_96]
WHLTKALGLGNPKSQILPTQRSGSRIASRIGTNPKFLRITFTEITKSAIQKSVKNPREIDLNLVDAQQARRILDRLVGYKLSPFLWEKVMRGLSAGRVQSVAVRLIVEREREIEDFKPAEFWEMIANLLAKNDENIIKAKLVSISNKAMQKLEIKSKKEADKIKSDLLAADYKIFEIKEKERFLSPPAPYRTATLQQNAGRRLRFSAKKTMFIAQKLYETGHISYMRTDSTNLSAQAIKAAREFISQKLGKKYLPQQPNIYKTKNLGAQEAHEAIRPTNPALEPDKLKNSLSRDEFRLYELIWRRMVASQTASARISDKTVEIKAGKYGFRVWGRTINFDGFLKIYDLGLKDSILPALEKGEKLHLKKLELNQKFTQPKPRYTEASLVRELEKRGIGRPSTYAPIMSTIEARKYVKKIDGYFHPEDVGTLVNDVLVEHFPEVVDYNFTAQMEGDLDKIAGGKLKWQGVIDEFYKPFAKHLSAKEKTLKKEDISQQKTGRKCPECKKGEVIIKMGRYGRFYACSGYPDCTYKKKIEKKEVISEETKKLQQQARELLVKNKKCAECGSPMAVRTSRYGVFLGCSNYPQCRQTIAIEDESAPLCSKCQKGRVVKRFTKKGKIFWGCSNYPQCDFASWTKP